ncbi:MAG: hypothetical protein ABIK15_07270 [Pseudomonadota bacterium]
MTIDGKIGSISHDDERARASAHMPVILTGLIGVSTGELPVGLVLTRNASAALVEYQEIEGEVLATGDGTLETFTGTLDLPVEPGTLVITDGVEAFADDGLGRLTGDAGGSGTVVYKTGAVSITVNTATLDETDITADYATAIDGILDETVDSAKTDSATYIIHGSVRMDALKVGAVAKAAPSTTLLGRLIRKGIYPE